MKTQHTLSKGGVSVAAARGGNTVTPFAIHNSRFTIQSKRSTVMKSTSIFRIVAAVVLAVFLVAGQVLAQGNLVNGGTFINTGTANFKKVQNYTGSSGGTINNSGNLNVTVAGGDGDLINSGLGQYGTVNNNVGATSGTITVARDYVNGAGTTNNNNSIAATIKVARDLTNTTGNFLTNIGTVEYNGTGAQSVLGIEYGGLVIPATAGGTKTLAGDATVNTTFTLAGATLAVSTHTLTIKTATLTTGGTLTSDVAGTVVYERSGDQQVFPANYGNLTFVGTGSITKSVVGTGGNVSIASTLTNPSNNTFDVGNNDLTFGASAIVSEPANAGTVKVAGAVTFSMANANIGGTFEYSSTADGQNVAFGNSSTQYKNLTLSGNASKNFAAQEYKVSGNFTVIGVTTTASFDPASTLHYNGSSAQTVAPLSYALLKFSEAGTKTLSGSASAQAASNTSVAVDVLSTNSPTFVIANGAALTVNVGRFQNASTVNINAGGSLTLSNGDLENNGTITNAGTITVQ